MAALRDHLDDLHRQYHRALGERLTDHQDALRLRGFVVPAYARAERYQPLACCRHANLLPSQQTRDLATSHVVDNLLAQIVKDHRRSIRVLRTMNTKAKRGRPAIDTTELRRHTYGVRLNDAEAAVLQRHAERLNVRPTTALRTLALERIDALNPQPVEATDIRIEIRRMAAVLQRIADRFANRRRARRPDTARVLVALAEAATLVGQVLAQMKERRQ